MEVQILKENLAKSIQAALKFTSTRTQMPILGHILIEAGDKGIYLTATDLEIGIRLRVAGKVVEPGTAVVPGRVLSDLVQHLPLGGVRLLAAENSLQILAGGVKARLQCAQAADFPPFLSWKTKVGKVDVGMMRQALEKVGFAVSSDEARPVLTGFLWLVNGEGLVATDGYRLSVLTEVKAWEAVKAIDRFLVPGKAMIQVMQTLSDLGAESCDFGYDESAQQILFSNQDLLLVMRVLAGDYPQYEAIMPTGSNVEVEVAREDLLEAVRSAAIFARDSANIVKLQVKDSVVLVSANAAQIGENSVEVEVENKKKGEIQVAFNSKYLIEFLTHSEANRVVIGLTDPLRAGLFREVNNLQYRHVIMPVRVREAA